MNSMSVILKKLKSIIDKKLGQASLAKKLNRDRRTLHAQLTGKRISLNKFLEICSAAGINPADLFGSGDTGTDESKEITRLKQKIKRLETKLRRADKHKEQIKQYNRAGPDDKIGQLMSVLSKLDNLTDKNDELATESEELREYVAKLESKRDQLQHKVKMLESGQVKSVPGKPVKTGTAG